LPIQTETDLTLCEKDASELFFSGGKTAKADEGNWDFQTAETAGSCQDKVDGKRNIQHIYAKHSENGVEALVLDKDNEPEGKVKYLGGSQSIVSKKAITMNNDPFMDWGNNGFRVIGFRYATDSHNDAIKSLQLLGSFYGYQ